MKLIENYPFIILMILLLSIAGCTEIKKYMNKEPFDIQGHRGARGLMPENSIEGFVEAVQLGVTTLEMDVVVTKDKQIVLSHEPWMSAEICLLPDGTKIKANAMNDYNIYNMTYEEVKKFDCGSKPHPRFPQQKKVKCVKPLLTYLIETIENYVSTNGYKSVYYNIETKCTPEGDNIYHPEPAEFVALLYEVLSSHKVLDKCIIQSFDIRTLQEMRKLDKKVKLALLVDNDQSCDSNLKILGFVPEIYSPNFRLVDSTLIASCHSKNMKIIPWTVNEKDKMVELKALGVDGLISDYPDVAMMVR